MITQTSARWRYTGLLLLGSLVASCASAASRDQAAAEIRGRIVFGSPGSTSDFPLVVVARPLSGAPGPAPETTRLRRADGAFSRSFVVVPLGGRVQFENEEEVCHAFFSSTRGNAFELGVLRPGQSGETRFEHPGFVHVYCSLKANRQVTILVVPTPHYTIVEPSGAFRIGGLAPGRYELETWHETLPMRRVEVTVGLAAPVNEVEIEVMLDDPPKRRS